MIISNPMVELIVSFDVLCHHYSGQPIKSYDLRFPHFIKAPQRDCQKISYFRCIERIFPNITDGRHTFPLTFISKKNYLVTIQQGYLFLYFLHVIIILGIYLLYHIIALQSIHWPIAVVSWRCCALVVFRVGHFVTIPCPPLTLFPPPPPPLPYPLGGLSSINSLCEENDNYISYLGPKVSPSFSVPSPVCLCFKAPNDTNISPSNH